MRPKCLPDNRKASVRACERASECAKAKERREEAGSVEGRSERACESERDARKRGVWREGASEREAQGNGECGGEEGVSRTGTN